MAIALRLTSPDDLAEIVEALHTAAEAKEPDALDTLPKPTP